MFKMKKTSFMVRCALQTPAMVLFLVVANPARADMPLAASAGAWNTRNSYVQLTNPAANHMVISQPEGSPTNNWVLNWSSFNISAGNRVQFIQPGGVNSNHIALNRIAGGASQILGQIDANGRVYLINHNGFLFGSTSVINVNSLVASSLALNISDEDFIANNVNLLNVVDSTNIVDKDGKVVGTSGDGAAFIYYSAADDGAITIEAGASILADVGGNVLIIAPEIINAGDIATTSGQVILAAAKDSVYLTPSNDPALRGFLVEVGGVGGDVTNLGSILAERGNITLAGLSINQNNLLQATTSINENGSIRLLARDGAGPDYIVAGSDLTDPVLIVGIERAVRANYHVASNTVNHTGGDDGVVLGATSQTVITPVASDRVLNADKQLVERTTTDNQVQQVSRVEITGHDITMQSGASITATGGEVLLHATSNPSVATINTTTGALQPRNGDTSLITLESGSRIDVSGTTDTQVAMQRNQLEIQLTGDFLRDAPLQRDGALHNERVNVDIREGTPLGDIAPDVAANIKRDINERLSEGGSVQLLSRGGVVMQPGSEVNIAGGAVNYDAGYINTSRLVTAQGAVVGIADANPDLAYSGTFGSLTITPERWGSAGQRSWSLFGGYGTSGGVSQYHEAYTEGRDAGRFTIMAPGISGMADVVAGSVVSPLARATTERAAGGRLDIITRSQNIDVVANTTAPDMTAMLDWLQRAGAETADFSLQLDDAVFNSGLTQVTLSGGAGRSGTDIKDLAGGHVDIYSDAQIRMAAGSSLTIESASVNVQGRIDITAGDVAITGGGGVNQVNTTGTVVVDGVIDVSGSWVNDNPDLNANLAAAVDVDAGAITINAANLQLTENSALLANGGGWLQADGKLQAGEGGDIELSVKNQRLGVTADLQLAGSMQAFGVNAARGGSLSLTTNRIYIAPDFASPAEPGVLQLTPDFFAQNGFADYKLTANMGELHVAAGSVIKPRASNLLLAADAARHQSGDAIGDFSHEEMLPGYTPGEQPLPDYARAATHLTLVSNLSSALFQGVLPPADSALTIEQGAVINADAGATVNLTSDSRLFMGGEITAHGGNINLTLKNFSGQNVVMADQAIWLDGELDVSGVFIAQPIDDSGLRRGQMFDGGQIKLTASDGFVITGKDSLMNVSAVADVMDLPASVRGNTVLDWSSQPVYGDAGGISITAAEGFRLGGDMLATAASATAVAGKLALALDASGRRILNTGDYGTSQGARQLNLVQAALLDADAPVTGSNLPVTGANSMIGQGWVAADSIQQAGFDQLTLTVANTGTLGASGVVNIHGDVALDMRQSLVVDTSILRGDGDASLHAAYVMLEGDARDQAVASAGVGSLDVSASGLLDVSGRMRLQGFDEVNLHSDGDLRARGINGGVSRDVGVLSAGHNLNLSADQIYTSSFSDFTFDTVDTLNIASGSGDAPVLSAGSVLSFNADVINHAGVVKAPLGEINFNATRQLNIEAGSLSSVSAEGQLIPFGTISGQRSWYLRDGLTEAVPDKRITLNSAVINSADGAVFDISGGGDIYAWEFVPGLGGSNDNLLPEHNNGAFAVMPGMTAYAPYDANWWQGETGFKPGDQVYLGASAELAAGLYTLLPARYALLPGAVLVTPTGNNMLSGQHYQQLDGASVVAGQTRVANTAIADQQWSGYVIENGATVRSRSEYFEATGSQFFRDAAVRNNSLLPTLAEDAGTLDILAQSGLNLDGSLRGDAAAVKYVDEDGVTQTATGRSSQVNIAGDELRVVNAYDADGGIQLLDDSLNDFGAASLLLGGVRSRTAEGTQVDVSASTVTITAGAELVVPDVILAATNTVTVASGASIHATGEAGVLDEVLLLQGDGALLRVSNAAQVKINRSNESLTPTRGVITVAAGAVLEAGASMVLDASLNTTVSGDLLMAGGSLNLGARRISLGDAPGTATGLVLNAADLNRITVDELVLTSRSSVDLYGDLDLTFTNLAIEAAAIAGYQQAGENASLHADTLRIGNASAASSNAAPGGSGDLLLDANNIELDDGKLAVRGFNHVTLQAADEIKLAGTGEFNVADSSTLTLDGRITASQRRAAYNINANAATLDIKRTATTPLPARSEALAASLNMQAGQIVHQGVIDLASGDVTLQATGTAAEVLLAEGSVINVSGITRDFAGDIRYSAGGNVELIADAGDINQQAGALLNVSGGGDQGAAGTLKTTAIQGDIELAGTLLAAHGTTEAGGGFVADANTLSNFSALNQQLNSSGFNQQRALRLRQGDITLVASETLVASDVVLAADAGNISINGLIDASGEKGGSVNLAARDNVTLAAGATINAQATGTDERGGQVFIETRQGMIDLAAGSSIQLGSTGTGREGAMHLRAPRTVGNNGINITSVATNISGVERVDVEGFRSYTPGSTLDSSDFTTPFSEATAFMANDILGTLDFSMALDNVHLRPGIEFTQTGNLAINGYDFVGQRYSNNGREEAGVLTVRATGNLNVNASLTDGFVTAPLTEVIRVEYDTLQAGESWSYRLAAGVDAAAAQVMATTGNTADMTLAANQKIRTGKGDIDLAVADDLTLNTGASIYSAGENTGYGSLGMSIEETNPELGEQGIGFFVRDFLLSGAQFPEHGGDVRLQTGGDISGNVSSYLASDWLHRIGYEGSSPTAWGVVFNEFNQGIGAFGGGNIQVSAGGDVNRLALYAPVTGRQTGAIGSLDFGLQQAPVFSNAVELLGGGDITLRAGGNITNALWQADRGDLMVQAGGSIGTATADSGAYLLLADTQADIAARGDVFLQGVSNATLQPLAESQRSAAEASGWRFLEMYFSTFTPTAALAMSSVGGDLMLRNTLANSGLFTDTQPNGKTGMPSNVYPGSLSMLAMDGDITLSSLTMLPAAQGQLSLLAQHDIRAPQTTTLTMEGYSPASIPGWESPSETSTFVSIVPSDGLLHISNLQPARIVARQGDIAPLQLSQTLIFNIPKAVEIIAGRDIEGVSLFNQNLRDSDVTLIQAGRDIRHFDSTQYPGTSNDVSQQFVVAGPGELHVIAGRDIDLGDSLGISSIGNKNNIALPDTGADVVVMAGVDGNASYDEYINQYFTADSDYSDDLISFMNQRGFSFAGDQFAAALAAFNNLGVTQQRSLVLQSYFNEIALSAQRAAAEQNNKLDVGDTDRFGYSRGLDAITALFPGSVLERRDARAGEVTSGNVIVTGGYAYTLEAHPALQGDVTMIASNITSKDNGGDINILVPGGLLNVGLPVAADTRGNDPGINSFGNGDINIFALSDIAVNQSRIQALNGGDIGVWSSLGNIDAGRGSKSALGIPQPVLVVDVQQNSIYQEYPAVVQGSGIRSACFDAGCEAGNIVLAAPAGVIDAGDAGINAAGNLTLATDTVLNAGNIEAGGESVGFTTETSAIGLDMGNLSNAAGDASTTIAGEDAADAFSNAAVAILQVEVMGLEDDDENKSAP